MKGRSVRERCTFFIFNLKITIVFKSNTECEEKQMKDLLGLILESLIGTYVYLKEFIEGEKNKLKLKTHKPTFFFFCRLSWVFSSEKENKCRTELKTKP